MDKGGGVDLMANLVLANDREKRIVILDKDCILGNVLQQAE